MSLDDFEKIYGKKFIDFFTIERSFKYTKIVVICALLVLLGLYMIFG